MAAVGWGGSTSPSTLNVGGPVAINVAGAGSGQAQVTITQNGSNLGGTWSTSFQNPAANDAGALSGCVLGVLP